MKKFLSLILSFTLMLGIAPDVKAFLHSDDIEQFEYSDVSPQDEYYNAVMTMSAKGLISGTSGGRFSPEEPAMRIDALKMILETVGTQIEKSPNESDAVNYLNTARKLGLVDEAFCEQSTEAIFCKEIAELVVATLEQASQSIEDSAFSKTNRAVKRLLSQEDRTLSRGEMCDFVLLLRREWQVQRARELAPYHGLPSDIAWTEQACTQDELIDNILIEFLNGDYNTAFFYNSTADAKTATETLNGEFSVRNIFDLHPDIGGFMVNLDVNARVWMNIVILQMDEPVLDLQTIYTQHTEALQFALDLSEKLHRDGTLNNDMSQKEIAEVYYDWFQNFGVKVPETGEPGGINVLYDTAYAALIRKEAACVGRAAGYALCLNVEGIPCRGMPGSFIGTDSGHVLNFMMLDGEAYLGDWGNHIANAPVDKFDKEFVPDQTVLDYALKYDHPEKPPVIYTITYDANGGTGVMSPVTVTENTPYTLPACNFTAPAGKEFKSWQIGGQEYAPGLPYTFTGDTTVTAIWQDKAVVPPVPATYTVTFDANGGIVTPAAMTTDEAGKLAELPAPTRDGYTFDGWYTAVSGGEKVDKVKVYTEDTRLYAHWRQNPPYTITFDARNDTTPTTAETDMDGKLTLADLPTPTMRNYTFEGWYTAASGGVLVTLDRAYTADTTIYAHWSGDEDDSYISIPALSNGSIVPSTRHAASGDRVTLYVHPDAGCELDTLTVKDVRGRTITCRSLGDDAYYFTMPDTRVTVDAGFTKIADEPAATTPAAPEPFTGLGTPGISGIVLNPAAMPFTDVKSMDWFYNNVDYVWKHYLMSGVSDTQFAPNTTTSRAMIWTILARMNNVRTDINPGSTWYEKGLLWAKEQGVTDGTNPMSDITREQLATMLWRNAGTPGGTGDLSQFGDSGSVSGYASTAMRWAVGSGILNGSDGNLDPQGTATRAQVAAMIARYGDRIGA